MRIVFKTYLSQSLDLGQLSGMFFLLAFAMIVSWRIAMYRSFTKLQKEMEKKMGFIMKRYEINLKLYMYKIKDSVKGAVFYFILLTSSIPTAPDKTFPIKETI